MRRLISAVVIGGLLAAACGKSAEEKAVEQAADDLKKATEAMAEAAAKQGTAAAAQGTADMAKAMQGMAAAFSGTGADGKPVNPVSFQTLQTQLPKVSGWDMRDPRGERMTMPMAYSQSEARYRKGDSSVDVKIMDTGAAPMLVAPWSMMLATGYSKESSDGYEKATTIGGNPAVEKWDSRNKRGELNILLGKRFMIVVEGHRLSDIEDLEAFTSALDFGAIAALK
jgi:hypothetical protein